MTHKDNDRITLFLIDGHALAYRAYYAFVRNPLINSKGENTSAAFGFTRMLLLLLRKYDPEYVGVVFDSEEETQRHRDFPGYKANRQEMPDDMQRQLPWIAEITEALGMRVVVIPGLEADDIIATLTREAVAGGYAVKIVTGDKDFFQLLSNEVHIIRPSKGTSLEDEIGPDYPEKRYGVKSSQVVDLLALMGDSSDNIPGVKGVGEKTAVKLLSEFESLKGIYSNLESVEPESLRKKLEAGRNEAFLSYDLVQLKSVPVHLDLEELRRSKINESRVIDLFVKLDFHQFLKELSLSDMRDERVDYRLVTDEKGLKELRAYLERFDEFVLDTETTSLEAMKAEIVGVSFCAEAGKAFYVPILPEEDGGTGLFDSGGGGVGVGIGRFKEIVGPLLMDDSRKKIGHNIKYDLIVMSSNGFDVRGTAFDTMIASYCLDPERFSHSLDNLAIEFLHHRMVSYKELFKKGDRTRDIRDVPVETLKDYSCEDADYTLRLKDVFVERLRSAGLEKLFLEIEMPLCLVLKKMEMNGVRIDVDKLEILSEQVSVKLDELTGRIYDISGERFNINSSKQLQNVLFDKLKLPSGRKTKTGYSTDSEVLGELAKKHEIARLILEYRQLAKFKSTYIDSLPGLINSRTGRIHTSFNQTVTATGRLSSSEPNLQNIPIRGELGREIRRAFIPSPGNIFVDADYSQIELRIMAHLSRDPELVRAFREGVDIHTRTASRIYGIPESEVSEEKRSMAKTINFGVIYGMGARGLARQLGISVNEASEFIGEYFKRYPGVMEFVERAKEEARKKGYAETILGRRRYLPDINSEDGRLKSMSERIAINMPVQGSAADMIKVAMIRIDRELERLGMGSKMIIQVHDELLFDVPLSEKEELIEIVRNLMENAVSLNVPVKAEIGTGSNWLEAHA